MKKSDKCTLCDGKKKLRIDYLPKMKVALKCHKCWGTGLEPWVDRKMQRLLERMLKYRADEKSDRFWFLDNEEVGK